MQLTDFVMAEWPLFLALIVILALLARTWFGGGRIKGVRPMEATRMINHDDALVLDVRTDKEFNEGHVLDAAHIPLGVLQSRLAELEGFKAQPVIVACRSGARSAQACGTLNKQGFTEVYNLSGGVLAWQSANLPLTTAKSKPPKPKAETKQEPAPLLEEAAEQEVPQEVAAEVESQETEAPAALTAATQSPEVVIYTTQFCSYCTRAKKLLASKSVDFKEIGINGKAELREEMEARAKSSSTPQIFIGDTHVGGCDELYALEKEGKLDELLAQEAQA
jgi:GrxC family glutaredoxin